MCDCIYCHSHANAIHNKRIDKTTHWHCSSHTQNTAYKIFLKSILDHEISVKFGNYSIMPKPMPNLHLASQIESIVRFESNQMICIQELAKPSNTQQLYHSRFNFSVPNPQNLPRYTFNIHFTHA